MRNRLVIGILVLVAVVGLYSLLHRTIVKTKRAEMLTPNFSAKSLLEEAAMLEDEGEMMDARNLYRRIIKNYPQDTESISVALKKEQELNLKILFSPMVDETSVVYTVKSGDTLSDIAKNSGTTVELIKKANNLKSNTIHPGQELKISKAKFSVFIDKSRNTLILKADDRILKTYTVSTGKDNGTPVGTFVIENRLADPTWHRKGKVVPPGDPENVLGKYWLGFDLKGYGIHGTNDESVIGQSVTEGCVRMHNADIEELFGILPEGTEVTIVD